MPRVRANEQPIDTATVIVVRRAASADAARLAELSEILGYPVASSSLSSRLERLLARTDDAVFVAEAESGVVGWIHGAEQELLESGRGKVIVERQRPVDPKIVHHGETGRIDERVSSLVVPAQPEQRMILGGR